ncbi:MAG: class I SAM-dependent methyltransferase [Gemmatimonadota bacterium]
MPPDPLTDEKIIDSWLKNAAPWTRAVRSHEIDSRRLYTDAAILDAVLRLRPRPRSAIDIGCGEGWLIRALSDHGVECAGVDVVPELIAAADAKGGGRFSVASYSDIANGAVEETADVVVANFSLIGHTEVERLVCAVPRLLNPEGSFVVQTLHPVSACGDAPYADGWRHGSWAGFSSEFTDPAPWYFRTMESWISLFGVAGFNVVDVREPGPPPPLPRVSVVFILQQ